MKKIVLSLVLLLQLSAIFCQMNDTTTMKDILRILNDKTYDFTYSGLRNDDNYIDNTGEYIVKELFTFDSIVVYYVVNDNLLSKLEHDMAISTGFELIIFSKKARVGIQFYYTNSHTISFVSDDIIDLKFNVSQDLRKPQINILNSNFDSIAEGEIIWMNRDLPKGILPHSIISIKYFKDNRKITKNIDLNFFTIPLYDLVKLIDGEE